MKGFGFVALTLLFFVLILMPMSWPFIILIMILASSSYFSQIFPEFFMEWFKWVFRKND